MPLFQLRSRWFSTIITKTARIGSMNHLKNINKTIELKSFPNAISFMRLTNSFFQVLKNTPTDGHTNENIEHNKKR